MSKKKPKKAKPIAKPATGQKITAAPQKKVETVKEEKKTMANVKQQDVPCILDSFKSIKKADKRHFLKLAKKMDISEEELLNLTINALVKGKIKFETKKVYVTI